MPNYWETWWACDWKPLKQCLINLPISWYAVCFRLAASWTIREYLDWSVLENHEPSVINDHLRFMFWHEDTNNNRIRYRSTFLSGNYLKPTNWRFVSRISEFLRSNWFIESYIWYIDEKVLSTFNLLPISLMVLVLFTRFLVNNLQIILPFLSARIV